MTIRLDVVDVEFEELTPTPDRAYPRAVPVAAKASSKILFDFNWSYIPSYNYYDEFRENYPSPLHVKI